MTPEQQCHSTAAASLCILNASNDVIHFTDTFGNHNQCFQGSILEYSHSLKTLLYQKEVVGSSILWALT